MRIYLLFFLVLFLTNCGKDNTANQKPPTKPISTPEKVVEENAKTITLLDAHTSSPSTFNEGYVLFDNSTNSMWASKPGTYQGEYVAADFLPSSNIVKSIGVKFEQFGNMVRTFRYRLTVNGRFLGEYKYNEVVPFNDIVESLKVQISYAAEMGDAIRYEGQKSIRVNYTQAGKNAGISEVWLFEDVDKPYKIITPQKSFAKVDNDLLSVFDNKKETVWIGKNEKLTFSTLEPNSVEKIAIHSGNMLSDFGKYSRPKRISISVDGNSQEVDIQDVRGLQVISLRESISGKDYTIEVLETYAGTKKEVAISGLSFLNGEQSWKPTISNYKLPVSEIDKTTIFSQFVNGHYANTWKPEDKTLTTAIAFRSNGTFDLEQYQEVGQQSVPQWNAKGTYKIISNTDKKAKLQLTGGMDDLEGRVSDFSETVTITPDGFKGTKHFENIYVRSN